MNFYGIMGIILLAIGAAFLITELRQRSRCSKSATGTVVGTYSKVESRGRGCYVHYYYPVYEYEVDGSKHIGKPKQCSKMKDWFKVGDTAKIYYNPNNPDDMTVKNYLGEIITGYAFIIASVVMFLIYFLR